MNEQEKIEIMKERDKQIQRIGKNRIYVIVFQVITQLIVVALNMYRAIEFIVEIVLLIAILIISMVLLQSIHKRILRIIWEPFGDEGGGKHE